jgi:hypothetical protein
MDPTQANVLSIDVLQRFRVALIRCQEELAAALAEADSEVDRAVAWVERDRILHWRQRVQRLSEEVNDARSALFRKQTVTSSKDSKPSVVDEKKALERAKAMLEDAERRGQRSRSWASALPRDQSLYKGGVAALATIVDRDLPAAIQALERMSIALERYGRDQAPDLEKLLDQPGATDAASMRRAGDADPPPSQEPQP